MKTFAEVIAAFIIATINMLLSGLVIWVAWPVMEHLGLPSLGYLQSCGLFILARTLIEAPVIRYNSKV